MLTDRARRRDALVLAAVLLVFGVLVWRELFNGWYPWDDGAMGQVVNRTLAGQLPHRDFDDPWTGGWTYLQAGISWMFGESLAAIRVPIFVAWLAGLAAAFAIARRFANTLLSALITSGCAVWSLYAWHLPLLNWYYAPLALASAWGSLRFTETRQHRWLVLAGLSAGIAIDIKITGFFLLAALLLWSLAQTARQPRAPVGGGGFGVVAYLLAGVYACSVTLLTWRTPGFGTGALHFVVPNTIVALWAAHEAAGARRSLRSGALALSGVAGPLLGGVLLAVAPLILWFALHGALHDLWIGVFVKPSARLSLVSLPPPSRLATTSMLAAPLLLLLGSRVARVTDRTATLIVAATLGLLAGVVAHDSTDSADAAATVVVRALPIALPLVACWWRLTRPDHVAESSLAFLLLALSATGQLIQLPFAFLPYFLYAAPLTILATAAVLAWSRESAEGTTVFASVFLIVAGAGHPALNAVQPPPRHWAALASPRAGIFVGRADSARYAAVAAVVAGRPSGPVHVVYDAPEYGFLLGRPSPTRVVYDVVADSASRNTSFILAQLDRAGVLTVILTPLAFRAWPAWPEMTEQYRVLRREFPHERRVGGVEVRWRDRVDELSAPRTAPLDDRSRNSDRHGGAP